MLGAAALHLRALFARGEAAARRGRALIVFLSAVAGIAAPYVFSRLIDTLRADSWGETIVWAFAGYGLLFGLSQALNGMVNYMAMMSAENLNFIAGTAFFERLLKKTISFFIDYNPAEIQQAKSRGQNAVYTLVQLGLIVLIPGIVQIILTLFVLGASINLEIVVIVFVYGAAFIAFTFFANRWTRPYPRRGDQGRPGQFEIRRQLHQRDGDAALFRRRQVDRRALRRAGAGGARQLGARSRRAASSIRWCSARCSRRRSPSPISCCCRATGPAR